MSDEVPSRVWSAEEVQQLRATQPAVTPWHVVRLQAWATLALVATAAVLQQLGMVSDWLNSVAWGAACALVPSAVMAWGLRREGKPAQMGVVFVRFFAWEAAKVLISLLLLIAAPKVVTPLNWLVMVIAFIVVMKAGFWGLLTQVSGAHRR